MSRRTMLRLAISASLGDLRGLAVTRVVRTVELTPGRGY